MLDLEKVYKDLFLVDSCSLDFVFTSLPASHKFCHLLITKANSFHLDQARQNVGHDLDPSSLKL